MIRPVMLNSANTNNLIRQRQNKTFLPNNLDEKNVKLSGFNNPMKAYISFGYCERNGGHYQKMYEIDTNFSQKITERIGQLEKLKNKAQQRYSLEDESNIEAAKIIMQYSNMQTVFAEMPPAYTIVTGTKLKKAMDKTQTFTNPIDNLIVINNITKIKGVNKELPQSQQSKATRAAQLYSTLILLNQIKANIGKLQFNSTQDDIKELVQMVEMTVKEIYGDDIIERVEKLSQMGRKVSLEDQKTALNFLIEIDCISKDLKLPTEFEEKLSKLAEKQNIIDRRTELVQKSEKQPVKLIKVFYPDHEHTMDHLTGAPHTHEHTHEHHPEHQHRNEYQTILNDMKSQKTKIKSQTVTQEEDKKKIYKGE